MKHITFSVVVVLGGSVVEGVIGKDVVIAEQDIDKIPELTKFRAVITKPPILSHFVKVCLEMGLVVAIVEEIDTIPDGARVFINEKGVFVRGYQGDSSHS